MATTGTPQAQQSLRFGLFGDVHKDIMHDADERLQIFVDDMNQQQVDFVLQLGDFCRPYSYNLDFLKIWERFRGPRYHVIGNHEVDGGFEREQVLEFWGVSQRYYSFDIGGYHFVVLDGNDVVQDAAPGYPRYVAADQLAWLRVDLEATQARVFLFCHQSLEDSGGIENSLEVRSLLEAANKRAGWTKVAACFSGHHHIDYHIRINGIHYIQINSMSNYWLGEEYQHIRYSDEIDAQFPWIKYTAPYKEALYSTVTLEAGETLMIEGTESEFVGPTPWDLGYPHTQWKDRIVPAISSRRLEL